MRQIKRKISEICSKIKEPFVVISKDISEDYKISKSKSDNTYFLRRIRWGAVVMYLLGVTVSVTIAPSILVIVIIFYAPAAIIFNRASLEIAIKEYSNNEKYVK
jgi:hypothetical protein